RMRAMPAAIFFEAQSFRYCDLSADAAPFEVAIVHRLREHWRDDEVAAIARFDLIIDLERVCRCTHEEDGAIFTNIDIIDASGRARPGVNGGIDDFESAGQKIDNRYVSNQLPLQTAHVHPDVKLLTELCLGRGFVGFTEDLA